MTRRIHLKESQGAASVVRRIWQSLATIATVVSKSFTADSELMIALVFTKKSLLWFPFVIRFGSLLCGS